MEIRKTEISNPISLAQSDFSANFLKNISSTESGSFVASPFSVLSVLAMLYLGAKGQTAKELGDALGKGLQRFPLIWSLKTFLIVEEHQRLKLQNILEPSLAKMKSSKPPTKSIWTRNFRPKTHFCKLLQQILGATASKMLILGIRKQRLRCHFFACKMVKR